MDQIDYQMFSCVGKLFLVVLLFVGCVPGGVTVIPFFL